MNRLVNVRLALMLSLLYGMFGMWFVTLGTYMSKGLRFDDIIGTAYGLQGVAIIVSTLFVGVIADRYLAAERLLGVLALLSGVSLYVLSTVSGSRGVFLTVLVIHFMVYLPMLPLSNAITFGAIDDVARQFPRLRIFGTLAWIAAGLTIGSIQGAAVTALPLRIGAALGIVLGLYAFTLPHTPPKARGEPVSLLGLVGLDFVAHVRDRTFWVFVGAAFLLMIPLTFYYAYANAFFDEIGLKVTVAGRRFEPAAIQTLGQVSELFFLLVLPPLLIRCGIKAVILMGMAAWVARYLMFAFGVAHSGPVIPLLLLGILFHGVCQDFFAVASQIYIDGRFGAAARARAQSFLSLIMGGLGSLIGANLAGVVYAIGSASPVEHDWRLIWLAPALFTTVVLAVFAAVFRERAPGA